LPSRSIIGHAFLFLKRIPQAAFDGFDKFLSPLYITSDFVFTAGLQEIYILQFRGILPNAHRGVFDQRHTLGQSLLFNARQLAGNGDFSLTACDSEKQFVFLACVIRKASPGSLISA
jgi:hypothetical protein